MSAEEETTEEVLQDEDVDYEELPQPHVIETGDSVKVKQVLDDSTVEIIAEAGYLPNFSWENLKLFLMFLSCVFALVAQFYPLPFPSSRPLLGACCAAYFILSTVLQFMITYIDKDCILLMKPNEDGNAMQIRTSFPRFQEWFTLIVQYKNQPKTETTAKMYVGKYFTSKGEFEEAAYRTDVLQHIARFNEKKYQEFEYNHKSD